MTLYELRQTLFQDDTMNWSLNIPGYVGDLRATDGDQNIYCPITAAFKIKTGKTIGIGQFKKGAHGLKLQTRTMNLIMLLADFQTEHGRGSSKRRREQWGSLRDACLHNASPDRRTT